jgi:hypothetical protein
MVLREEYEDLQRLLEDLVEDVDELVETPIGLSGTMERGSDAEGTEEISGIQTKGKLKAVEVVDTPRFRTRRHMGVTEGKAANPATIAPSNTKSKTRAVAVVDTGSKHTTTHAKATVVGMPLKRHTTTTAKKPTAKPITRGGRAGGRPFHRALTMVASQTNQECPIRWFFDLNRLRYGVEWPPPSLTYQ